MVQTIIVVLLLVADAMLILLDADALQAPFTVAVPGTAGVTATPMLMLVAAGAALVLGWLAGQVDRAILERRIRHRDATLRVMGEELLRLKAAAYEQQPSLAELRGRVDALDRDVRALEERLHERIQGTRVYETADSGDRSSVQRVTVTG
jgi:hypothetical protein